MKDIHGGNIWEAARKAGVPPEKIIDFSASINPLGLSTKAMRAVRESLRLIPPYPEPSPLALRKSLGEYHGLSEENILAGNGSTEFIYLLPRVLKAEKALVVEPAFSEYRSALAAAGVRVRALALSRKDGFALDMDRFKKALKEGFQLVFIANPANPTGVLTPKEMVFEASRECAGRGATLVVDEAFMDFSEGESVKAGAVGLKNLIVLRSLTKFFAMAGLRAGYMIANGRLIKMFSGALPPWSVNTPASCAAVAALKDASYREKTLRWLARERPFLEKGLASIKGLTVLPGAANYLTVRSEGISAPELKSVLFNKGILIRDLSGINGLGPSYFRVAVLKRKENQLLIEAIEDALQGRGD